MGNLHPHPDLLFSEIRNKQSLAFLSPFFNSVLSFFSTTLSLCRWKKSWEKGARRRHRGGSLTKERTERKKWRSRRWHLSAVAIKACALKRGQSIQLSASTSHQASWRQLKMSGRAQTGSSGSSEGNRRITGDFSSESIITDSEKKKCHESLRFGQNDGKITSLI